MSHFRKSGAKSRAQPISECIFELVAPVGRNPRLAPF